MPSKDRERKQKQFAGGESGRGNFWPLALFGVGCAAILVIAGYWMWNRGGPAAEPGPASAELPAPAAAAAAGPEIRVPLAELAGGRAKFVDYKPAAGDAIRLFAVKDSDGQYRAALDTCEVCFAAKKGYVQRGDHMVCRKCGNAYAPSVVDDAPGGCHPVGVPRRVEGDNLVLSGADVEQAHQRLAAAGGGGRGGPAPAGSTPGTHGAPR